MVVFKSVRLPPSAAAITADSMARSCASRESCSKRHVMMMISLSFLAPDLVTAAMQSHLPRGVGVTRLIDAPMEWSRQWRMLGIEFLATFGASKGQTKTGPLRARKGGAWSWIQAPRPQALCGGQGGLRYPFDMVGPP